MTDSTNSSDVTTKVVGIVGSVNNRHFAIVAFLLATIKDGEVTYTIHDDNAEAREVTESDIENLSESGGLRFLRKAPEWEPGDAGNVIRADSAPWTGVAVKLPSTMSLSNVESGDSTQPPMPQLIREPLVAVWLGRKFEAAATTAMVMPRDFRKTELPGSVTVEMVFNDGYQDGVLTIMRMSDAAAVIDRWLSLPASIIKNIFDASDGWNVELTESVRRTVEMLASLIGYVKASNLTILAVRAAAAPIAAPEVDEVGWQISAHPNLVRIMWTQMLQTAWDSIDASVAVRAKNADA